MTRIKTSEKRPDEKPAGLPCPDSSASFWHSEPNLFLLHHRTTPDLPAKADVVIVGSGITGASAARYLAESELTKDMRVVMIDAREICWGATGRNGGHCQPLLFDRTPDIAEFEVKNVEAVKSYIQENEIACEWRNVTACRTFWDKAHFEAAKKDIQKLRDANPQMGQLVTVANDEDTFKRHRVRSTCSGVTLTKGAGQLWPYKYVTAIVEKLIKAKKLNVQTNTPVLSIEGQTLVTPRGKITANNIILATNGYTSHLIHEYASLIVPVRCEMSALHPTSSRLPSSYGMVGFGGGHPDHDDYLVQRPFYEVNGQQRGGHLMFGGGRTLAMYNCVGETDDDIVDPGEADYLRRVLPKMLDMPGDELKASHQWTGIKGYSRDNSPWVGQIREGLWISAGYTGHGMPNATLCAKAVVDMILGKDGQALIDAGELPQSYLITPQRISEARKLASVWEQDTIF